MNKLEFAGSFCKNHNNLGSTAVIVCNLHDVFFVLKYSCFVLKPDAVKQGSDDSVHYYHKPRRVI